MSIEHNTKPRFVQPFKQKNDPPPKKKRFLNRKIIHINRALSSGPEWILPKTGLGEEIGVIPHTLPTQVAIKRLINAKPLSNTTS